MDGEKEFCEIKLSEMTTSEILYLMEIYLQEWTARDSRIWQQIFAYFTAALIIAVLPLGNLFGVEIPDDFPEYIFPITAAVLSVIFLFVVRAYSVRLIYAAEAYAKVIRCLPEDLRRNSIKEKSEKAKSFKYKLYNIKMSEFIGTVMFVMLFALSVILFVYFIKK